MRDDLGAIVDLPRPPRRVVSLVPSLTEAVAPTGLLVGATDWCTHPADLDVTRVRGTKNPDRAAVEALAPDLVLAVQEENRELDVRRLRDAGVPVWVSVIETVDQAFAALHRLLDDVLQVGTPPWLADAERAIPPAGSPARHRVAVPIWRDPWMVVGARTFTGDLLARFGATNVYDEQDGGRYPHTDATEIARRADLVLLPDEPYEFTADDGPEAFGATPTRLISGRVLTWYGPSLLAAATEIPQALNSRHLHRS